MDGSYDGGYGGTDGSYGGGDGSYNDGCYGSCGTSSGPRTLSGYVYFDADSNGTFSPGDSPIAGDTIQVVIPAYTVPAWTEITSTDENGNPTGFVDHPAQSFPEEIKYTAVSDAGGHYSITNITQRSYEIRHITSYTTAYRINPSTSSVTLNMNMNRFQSFGLYYSSQNIPQNPCSGVNPTINLSWSPAIGASSYEIFYVDQAVGTTVDNNIITTGTTYTFTSSSPLVVGRNYGFIIASRDINGAIMAYSDNNKWSYQKFGTYTQFPVCSSPPSAFSFTAAPAPYCTPAGVSTFTLSWSPSSGAQGYRLTPRTTNTAKGTSGTMPQIDLGLIAPNSQGNVIYDYAVPGAIAGGEAWSFAVVAYSGAFTTPITGTNSQSVYGWRNAINCSVPPTVNFSVNTPNGNYPANGIPAHANQGSSVTLNWSSTNSPTSCTATSSQSYWNGTVPSSGSQAVNTSLAGTINFALQCSNFSGASAVQNIQLIIDQYPKPYIQTTGGDVHTNEDIYITP